MCIRDSLIPSVGVGKLVLMGGGTGGMSLFTPMPTEGIKRLNQLYRQPTIEKDVYKRQQWERCPHLAFAWFVENRTWHSSRLPVLLSAEFDCV